MQACDKPQPLYASCADAVSLVPALFTSRQPRCGQQQPTACTRCSVFLRQQACYTVAHLQSLLVAAHQSSLKMLKSISSGAASGAPMPSATSTSASAPSFRLTEGVAVRIFLAAELGGPPPSLPISSLLRLPALSAVLVSSAVCMSSISRSLSLSSAASLAASAAALAVPPAPAGCRRPDEHPDDVAGVPVYRRQTPLVEKQHPHE